jgi:hypothetical protein
MQLIRETMLSCTILKNAGDKPQVAGDKHRGDMKLSKQYYSYVHYYYLYSHNHLPKNYVLKWKKYLDDNYQMERYYSFFTKEDWKRQLMELPKYHKYILNAERQAASLKQQATSFENNRK